MHEIHEVTIQVREPMAVGDAGQVSTGYYVIEGGAVVMTDSNGAPMLHPVNHGKFALPCTEGNHRSIAASLTREVRRALRGETKELEKFRQPIFYPGVGVA